MPIRVPTCCRAVPRHVRSSTVLLKDKSIWISDDMLMQAFNDFTLTSRTGCRYGSNVPGPLEAQRRLGKRKMTAAWSHDDFPQPPLFDITRLWPFGKSKTNESDWQWQPPRKVVGPRAGISTSTDVSPHSLILSNPAEETVSTPTKISTLTELPQRITTLPDTEMANPKSALIPIVECLVNHTVSDICQEAAINAAHSVTIESILKLVRDFKSSIAHVNPDQMLSISTRFGEAFEECLRSRVLMKEQFLQNVIHIPYLTLDRYAEAHQDCYAQECVRKARRVIVLATWRGYKDRQGQRGLPYSRAIASACFIRCLETSTSDAPRFYLDFADQQLLTDTAPSVSETRLHDLRHSLFRICQPWLQYWIHVLKVHERDHLEKNEEVVSMVAPEYRHSVGNLAEIVSHLPIGTKAEFVENFLNIAKTALSHENVHRRGDQYLRLLGMGCLTVFVRSFAAAGSTLNGICTKFLQPCHVDEDLTCDLRFSDQAEMCSALLEHWHAQSQHREDVFQITSNFNKRVKLLKAERRKLHYVSPSPAVCLTKALSRCMKFCQHDPVRLERVRSMMSTLFMMIWAMSRVNDRLIWQIAVVNTYLTQLDTLPTILLERLFSNLSALRDSEIIMYALPSMLKLHHYTKTRLLVMDNKLVDIVEHCDINPWHLWSVLGLNQPNKQKRILSDREVGIIIDMSRAFARSKRFTARQALRHIMHCMHLLNASRTSQGGRFPEVSRAVVHSTMTTRLLQDKWPGDRVYDWVLKIVERHEGHQERSTLQHVVGIWYDNHRQKLEWKARDANPLRLSKYTSR